MKEIVVIYDEPYDVDDLSARCDPDFTWHEEIDDWSSKFFGMQYKLFL